MTFDRAKNVGLALLTLLLAFLALLGHWESRLSREVTRAITLVHNPAHLKAKEQLELLHAADIAFEVYRRHERVDPQDVSRLFDELLRRAHAIEPPSGTPPAMGDREIGRSVAAARAAWLQILEGWEREADLTSDSLHELVRFVADALGTARRRLRDVVVAGDRVVVAGTAVEEASSLIHLLEIELDQFVEQEPISLEDVIFPIGRLVGSLGESLDEGGDEGQLRAQTLSSRSDALRLAQQVHGLLFMLAELEGHRWADTYYGEVLDETAQALKATEAAVRKLGRHWLDDVSASAASLEADLGAAARLRAVLSVLGVALAVVVAIGLNRILRRHVHGVIEGTQALASGQLEHRIEVRRRDRLGRLADAFNTLAERLQEKEREQHLYVEALDRAVAEAQAANVAKSRFLASMSHEIRTPINGVLGTTDLLLRETLSRSQRHLVETIERSGTTLLGVINDILDFSKIEAGHVELETVPFDLVLLIEDVCEMAAPAAHRKGLEISCVIPPELSSAVLGDALRLRQVLTNLVGNAIKFTPEGEVVVEVARQGADGSVYRISVRDTGIGIAADAQGTIYKAFSQANRSTTRQYGGTGLGLSITLELVSLMGGETGLESAPGEGSTFWITLPLPPDPDASERRYDELPCARALLVSGNPNTCRALGHRLDALGVSNTTVSSGRGALHALAHDGPRVDVVFVDTRLADMGGLEFAHRIAADESLAEPPPRVALCLLDEEESLLEARRAAGIVAQLPKPVRQSALYNCLLELGGLSRTIAREKSADTTLQRLAGHVLLVEDHPINQDIVTRMLRGLGCEVALAENGRVALERLERERFDLVLMDCDMPDMDGFEATRVLRAREAADPSRARQGVIALTANALGGDRERCLEAGMDDYLTKPIVTGTLHRVLARRLAPAPYASADPDPARDGDGASAPTPPDAPATGIADANGATSGAGERAVLDPQVIDGLRAMEEPGEEGFVAELVRRFSANWTVDHAALLEALSRGETETVRRTAHRLKSASANLGAVELAALCGALESAAARHDVERAAREAARLDPTYRRALGALQGTRREAA